MTISPSQAPTKIDTIPISPYHALDLSFLCASPSPGNSPSHAAQIGKPRASHLSVPPPRMDLKPTPHCCTAPYHIFPTMRLYRTHHHPPDTHHKLHTALASPTQNPNPPHRIRIPIPIPKPSHTRSPAKKEAVQALPPPPSRRNNTNPRHRIAQTPKDAKKCPSIIPAMRRHPNPDSCFMARHLPFLRCMFHGQRGSICTSIPTLYTLHITHYPFQPPMQHRHMAIFRVNHARVNVTLPSFPPPSFPPPFLPRHPPPQQDIALCAASPEPKHPKIIHPCNDTRCDAMGSDATRRDTRAHPQKSEPRTNSCPSVPLSPLPFLHASCFTCTSPLRQPSPPRRTCKPQAKASTIPLRFHRVSRDPSVHLANLTGTTRPTSSNGSRAPDRMHAYATMAVWT
ncbi:hypothetical protein EYC84_006560 [Monilinia fructicola]|uniref:Uncharacterized protein n=1 Tax=Monilinia fructicola TaxID=38448 RepID=A0A5M9K3T2_MONFR|nr:hypothetical protein EYC84_006560 [Monilinia fructicola]